MARRSDLTTEDQQDSGTPADRRRTAPSRTESSPRHSEEIGVTEHKGPRPKRLDRIARRAYEIYQARGGQHGQDLNDWLQAEREIDSEDGGQ